MAISCKPTSSEPCDGVGLAIAGFWSVFLPLSVFFGIVVWIITFVILSLKKEKTEKLK